MFSFFITLKVTGYFIITFEAFITPKKKKNRNQE